MHASPSRAAAFEGTGYQEDLAADMPQSSGWAMEDDICLVQAQGQSHALAEAMHAVNQGLQPLCRPGQQDHIIRQRGHQAPTVKLQACGDIMLNEVIMKATKEDARQRGAERTSLPRTHLLHRWASCCAIDPRGQCAASLQRLDGCKHAWTHANRRVCVEGSQHLTSLLIAIS